MKQNRGFEFGIDPLTTRRTASMLLHVGKKFTCLRVPNTLTSPLAGTLSQPTTRLTRLISTEAQPARYQPHNPLAQWLKWNPNRSLTSRSMTRLRTLAPTRLLTPV